MNKNNKRAGAKRRPKRVLDVVLVFLYILVLALLVTYVGERWKSHTTIWDAEAFVRHLCRSWPERLLGAGIAFGLALAVCALLRIPFPCGLTSRLGTRRRPPIANEPAADDADDADRRG